MATAGAQMVGKPVSAITVNLNLLRAARQMGRECELLTFICHPATRPDTPFAVAVFKRDGQQPAG